MGWHLRPLAQCQEYRCRKPATVELYNAVNARSGVFCSKDGALELKRVLAEFQEDS